MFRKRRLLEKPKIDMTPMIDVVFLLLTFFVLTFRIFIPEGDFNVQMSAMGQVQPAVEMEADSIQIRLIAQENGLLAAIQLNSTTIEDFEQLRRAVSEMALMKPDLEIVFCPDEYLHYEYIIQAITAVNGEIREGQFRKITDNIKFAREPKK